MRKKSFYLLLVFIVLILSGCGKEELDQTEIYEKINDLAGNFPSDYISYQVKMTAEDKNINLYNEGTLKNVDGIYTYTYSYQTLNKIGSDANSLISTTKGEYKGSKEEILANSFGMAGTLGITGAADTINVFALNLKDSFKSHKIAKDGDSYVMTGYIARNTIIKYTEGIDDDIRFYYKITVNADVTEIETLEISYVTTNFDSVVITLKYKEAEK